MQTASVIVVSHGRPDALTRCLLGISQIDHLACEVIVVSNAASAKGIPDKLRTLIKLVTFETSNIAAARNAGIAVAAGDIVAFIDDDAVPEPTWLTHLTAPFADPAVAAAGGFVRGRNGISFQWQARLAFADGTAVPITVHQSKPTLMAAGTGRAVKTEGTNMAIRRSSLVAIGGFDPAFAFYLDETDVNMRLAESASVTAIVPLAQVHHGFAASARRNADRVPRDLFQIAASTAVFLRKHGPDRHPTPHVPRALQRQRLLRHMVAGRMMPGDVGRLLRSFDQGWADGMKRVIGDYPAFDAPPAFLPFPARPRPHRMFFARSWQAKDMRQRAARAVSDGQIVSLFVMSPTGRYHTRRFTADGVWEQSGGQFGRSDRSDRLWHPWRAKDRMQREMARLAPVRHPVGIADSTVPV